MTISNQAHAVPLQITQQVRILDNNGTTVFGVHDVTFRMYDTKNSGSPLWSETLVISLNNGYYAAILGTDESRNPLDSSVLGLYPLYLELQTGTIRSLPYFTKKFRKRGVNLNLITPPFKTYCNSIPSPPKMVS